MKRNLLIITLLFLGSFVILLLGNIIIIGEKIASLSHVAWAEYAFYTLILVVFYVVVIRPVVRVHRAPQIPALSIDGEMCIRDRYKSKVIPTRSSFCNCFQRFFIAFE